MRTGVPSPEQAAARARRDLEAMARPASGFDASRYFRGDTGLGFHNVGTRQTRALARAIYRANRDVWSVDDAMVFADALIVDRYLETKSVGIELVACYRPVFRPRLLNGWKRWLAQGYSSNWATTDNICGSLIGPLLLQYPALLERVAGWVRHPSIWVRRAAAVGLIPSVRRGIGVDLAYDVAHQLNTDREDMIQKAVGWMLREAGKADAARLERYLLRSGRNTPRTTVRYAIERFPPAKRRALLRETKRIGGRQPAPERRAMRG